jgi:hypothetical protein
MDECTVSNAKLATLVAIIGYRTLAERPSDPAVYPGADPAVPTSVPRAC